MSTLIREARTDDVALIAWVIVEAARSGKPIGFWDLAFPGADQPRLGLVEQIALAEPRSFAHLSGFLVAELDGVPVGALSGYSTATKKVEHLVAALTSVLIDNGWNDAHRALLGTRIAPVLTCLPDTPEDRFIVEWVALRPEARGKGLAAALVEAILDRGRAEGFTQSQIAVAIGNTPAEQTYLRAGFTVEDEKRHPDFEAICGWPGIARMHRAL